MARTDQELQGVTLLGNQGTVYADNYAPQVLETFPNKHPENEYLVTFNCPEFTTLCPKTGQPDFGKIIINYIPRERMVESGADVVYGSMTEFAHALPNLIAACRTTTL